MFMYYCLIITMLLPLILALSSIPFRLKELSFVDLNEPRAQGNLLTGAGGRIVAAQKNAWEALILFSVTIFIAFAHQVNADDIETACTVFILARICHAVLYVGNYGLLRFISFFVSIGAIASIIWESVNI